LWFTLDLQFAELVKRKHCSLMKKSRILLYFIASFVFLRSPLRADRRAFSYYDVGTSAWKAEPGKFAILVGSSSAQIELPGEFTLK